MMHGGGGGMMHGGMMHGGAQGVGLRRAGDLVDDIEFGKAYDQTVITRLFKYLEGFKLRFALAMLGMIVYTLTTLATPYLIGYAFDKPITQGNLWGWNIANPSLMLVFIAFVFNGLLSWGSQWLQTLSMAYVGRGVLFVLRTQMFNHLQKLSMSFYDRHEVGRVMSRVQNDVGSLQEVLASGVIEIIADVLSLGGIVFMLFFMNARLALITLTIIPVMVIVLAIWQKYARVAFMRVRMAISVVNAGLQENISGARVIQSLSRETENYGRFDSVNEANLGANLSAARLSAGILPVIELLMGGATALVIIYGGAQAIAGELMLGQLVAFILYVQRFFEPIRSLAMQYTQLQRAMAGGQRIFEVLDSQPEIADAADAVDLATIKGDIEFQDVGFEYVPGLEVLHDINLHIHPGETVALVGATGAGKSSIISLVGRFYDITRGHLRIDGHDIKMVTQRSLRQQVGVVLQEPFLFSSTVRENIMYGREGATEEEMIEAAKAVGVHDFVQRLEYGYDTELQERGSNLSVGQRQLISFARAVLADPRILMLDEATANVDTQTEILIQQALRRLLKGRTSLVIAHRLSTIHDADRVVVIEDGKIAEIGNHEQLMQKQGIYYRLYSMSYAAAGGNGSSGNDAPAEDRPAN
ncbi:MAG: ABC transporter ATP-binding protein [Dehalococcoidales bacterium]|nr:ABC transporter ATP-binding protein [Dehalococcoidales bacterium]